MKVADRKNEIYKQLIETATKTIVLYGKSGVGKTWTAREVSNYARRQGKFDFVLWVYLNREYDENSLRVSIAQQLSLLPTRRVSEVEEDDEESRKEEVLKDNDLTKKIKDKELLIVLDDEGHKMDEAEIRKMLDKLLEKKTYKVLVTTRNDPNNVVPDPNNIVADQTGTTNNKDVRMTYKVDPMIRDEALSLLKERAFSDKKLEKGIDTLAENFLERTGYMPGAILMMAKMFKYFSDKKMEDLSLLRPSLVEPSDSKIYKITDLLCSVYDLVPVVILIDCQRDARDKERPYYSDSHCINHNELIAYWMMEGYLGHITCMDTAYRKGHEILMELLDFQILKRVEADYVTLNPLGNEFDDYLLQRKSFYYRSGYYSHARLGLDSVFDKVGWKGLVRLSHKGGVMRTLPNGKVSKKVSVLILDGNSLAKDILSESTSSLKKLHVLAIFNPTLDILTPFTNDIVGLLHILVLRSCRFLNNLDRVQEIKKYENLTVLEISGPIDSSGKLEISEKVGIPGSSSFKEFPKDFFDRMPKLQSLNLSSLPITSLPSSLFTLKELKWLILRGCTSLETLSSLKDCTNLVMLDCAGSTSLKNLQDRSFVNADLEMINLSDTKINILPLIGGLKKLTHLLLSRCTLLNRLRSIKDIASLEVIDLSNASDFNEFFDKSLVNLVNLKVLDLSGTGVGTLPADIGNPKHLCLENCTQLGGEGAPECLSKMKDLERFVLSNAAIQSLPPISHLTNLRQLSVTCCFDLVEMPDLSSLEKLEELDFSGCKKIESILDNTFKKMSRLQKLDLSGTSIKSLPSLANLCNLRRLLLKDCEELRTLSLLESKSLGELEELNVSGGKALRDIGSNFFEGTVNLRILDLSDTLLNKLPSLSELKNLHELRLRNCHSLKTVPDLETLTTLEILDLSGSAVSNLPLSSSFGKLRELILNNCTSLEEFQKIRTLNVLRGPIQDLPYGISRLTKLERLDLPSMDDFQGPKLEEFEWGISSLAVSQVKRPYVSVGGTQFLTPLLKDPSLWESTLKKFYLCVYPKNSSAKIEPHFQGDYFLYRDIYLRNRQICESDDQRLLEIFGFTGGKPADIDTVLTRANQVFFVDNEFQGSKENNHSLPSFFTACESKQIKGCWIEKCKDLEVIFGEKEIGKIIGLLNTVETIWVSNAMNLKSIFDILKDSDSGKETPKDEVLQNLEKLYLEYCPKVSTVFSSHRLPQKLKNLQIKYCDDLGNIFHSTSLETRLQYLESLHLWELPKLESIGSPLPSLKTLKISNCPNLQNLEETIRSAESLQNLSISNVCGLENLHGSRKLVYLSVESCPNLVEVVTFGQRPSDLEIRIRFCNKLKAVVHEGMSLEIKSVHLHGLPSLKYVGATVSNQASCFIVDCPNLRGLNVWL